jgi:rhamnosyltransferase
MKNVYDIRRDKKLYFVLPDNCIINKNSMANECSVAVIVNLYYIEHVDWYLKQLYQISGMVDVYVISSRSDILDIVSDQKIHLVKKINRGRDISALLVSGREIVYQYEYICFLHDKKARNREQSMLIKAWLENMWLNLIGTKDYIENVLGIFKNNSNIGLLVPPETAGMDWKIWGTELWESNFERVQKICNEWNLNCDIDPQIPPITIGTAFWCKTAALSKLFSRNWQYEDFDDEPLPDDGTLSHAIERILAYVAQDAGYDTGTIMSSRYASKQFLMYQDCLPKVFEMLQNDCQITSFSEVEKQSEQNRKIQEFCNRYEKVYLYGGGVIGEIVFYRMEKLKIKPEGIIVSKLESGKSIAGMSVIPIDMIEFMEDIGIIVSVGNTLKGEIVDILEEKGFHQYLCYIDL